MKPSVAVLKELKCRVTEMGEPNCLSEARTIFVLKQTEVTVVSPSKYSVASSSSKLGEEEQERLTVCGENFPSSLSLRSHSNTL